MNKLYYNKYKYIFYLYKYAAYLRDNNYDL